MKYIAYQEPILLIADEGKKLRLKSDVYKAATETEEEHIPYTTGIVFLPKSITEEQAKEMYVEEEA